MIVQNMAALCPYRIGDYLQTENPHGPRPQLARHKLGTPAGPDADGGQRHLPRGQRGRRGTAYSHCARDSAPSASAPRVVVCVSGRSLLAICTNPSLRQNRQHGYDDTVHGRRSAAQQPAALSRGVHLASDSLIPERGCAA